MPDGKNRYDRPHAYQACSRSFTLRDSGLLFGSCSQVWPPIPTFRGSNVRVRAAPATDADAAILTTANFSIVKATGGPTSEGWAEVELVGQRKGYIATRFVRSPIDYRAIFSLTPTADVLGKGGGTLPRNAISRSLQKGFMRHLTTPAPHPPQRRGLNRLRSPDRCSSLATLTKSRLFLPSVWNDNAPRISW